MTACLVCWTITFTIRLNIFVSSGTTDNLKTILVGYMSVPLALGIMDIVCTRLFLKKKS